MCGLVREERNQGVGMGYQWFGGSVVGVEVRVGLGSGLG